MISAGQHVSLSRLALHARGDAGFWRRRLVESHLDRCEECSATVNEFVQIQAGMTRSAAALPVAVEGAVWQALASEMSANIRLGLAAGECVSSGAPTRSRHAVLSRPRLSAALAGLTLLAVLLAMEHPALHHAAVPVPVSVSAQATLEASGDEVMVRNGDRGLSMPAPAGTNVIRTVSSHGAVRSRYVDTTGVTIVNVYAE